MRRFGLLVGLFVLLMLLFAARRAVIAEEYPCDDCEYCIGDVLGQGEAVWSSGCSADNDVKNAGYNWDYTKGRYEQIKGEMDQADRILVKFCLAHAWGYPNKEVPGSDIEEAQDEWDLGKNRYDWGCLYLGAAQDEYAKEGEHSCSAVESWLFDEFFGAEDKFCDALANFYHASQYADTAENYLNDANDIMNQYEE